MNHTMGSLFRSHGLGSSLSALWPGNTDDLAKLETLDDWILLDELRARFNNHKYYTFIGDVVLMVSPVEQVLSKLSLETETDDDASYTSRPHVTWTTHEAYQNMQETGNCQYILINGETGSGKTKCAKFAVHHLVKMAPSFDPNNLAWSSNVWHQRITAADRLLETFGNAQISISKNSSRFGKLTEIHYDQKNRIEKVEILTYVLEKSRVTQYEANERNFHIFYCLFAGLSSQERQKYSLGDPSHYRIWHQRNEPLLWSTAECQRFKEEYFGLIDSMKNIGLSAEDIEAVFTLLAAIIHIRNIEIKEDPVDCEVSIERHNSSFCSAADLLGVEENDLETVLLSESIVIRDENISRLRKKEAVEEIRDALSREMYSRVFHWIVDRINKHLKTNSHCNDVQVSGPVIGVLDWFGFEQNELNGFEQMCTNAVNEMLQRLFLDTVFVEDIRLYKEEGLAIEADVLDNQPTVDLFFTDGIFSAIDEECASPKATDDSLMDKLNSSFSQNPCYKAFGKEGFAVQHFAGKVFYNARGFVKKNLDSFPSTKAVYLARSKNIFVRSLFKNYLFENQSNGDNSEENILTRLRPTFCQSLMNSLSDLISKVSLSKKWFIRCVRSDNWEKPGEFVPSAVMKQLSNCGLVNLAKLRQQGYAVRLSMEEFVDKFQDICYPPMAEVKKNADTCQLILQMSPLKDYAVGKTKVFLHQCDVPILDSMLEAKRYAWKTCKLSGLSSNAASSPRSTPTGKMDSVRGMDPKLYESTASQEHLQNWLNSVEAKIHSKEHIKLNLPVSEEANLHPSSWDRFLVIPRETISAGEKFKPFLKLCKCLGYIFLFVTVLFSAVTSKMCILLLATSIPKTKEIDNGEAPKTMLVLAMLFPYVSWFFFNTAKSFFGGNPMPSWKMLASVLTMELLHTFGLCLLVLRLLTKLDILCALILTSGLYSVPAFLKTLTVIRDPSYSTKKRTAMLIFNVVALIVQLIGLPLCLSADVIIRDQQKETMADGVLRARQKKFNFVERLLGTSGEEDEGHFNWQLAAAMILVSLTHWENFIEGDVNIFGLEIKFSKWKKSLHLVREKLYIFVSVWKVTWTIVFALFFMGNLTLQMKWPTFSQDSGSNGADRLELDSGIEDNITTLSNSAGDAGVIIPAEIADNLKHYGLLYSQFFSSLACSYFGGLACKLCMQNIGFSLPLVLSMPTCALLVILQCHFSFLPATVDSFVWVCPGREALNGWTITWLVLLWLSRLVICSHIWFSKSGRLARIERLFVLPMRCGILTEENLLLRRRNDRCAHVQFDDEESEEVNLKADDTVPMIYACATMWHETRSEMTQLLKSIFRLDIDHSARDLAQKFYKIKDPDYYEFEAHLFFDDAFEINDDNEVEPNSFVIDFVECIDEALSCIHERKMMLGPPGKSPTPYGGKLTWKLPGGTRLILHMKDNRKIRHKKRWSQVMYMYYLLGYKIMSRKREASVTARSQEKTNGIVRLTPSQLRHRRKAAHFTRSVIFNYVDEEVHTEAENTFLLTLDGDVNFQPDAVRLLIDRLKKNKKVGAACGRIHPTGSGPMLWYQQFEYAIGHWLQKATEHVFGCVLCAPGCFSLFRGSALMDDNVCKMYTTRATEAAQCVQCDQGEDRWLSTLILQQGYRIDYCAAADAMTHAPETFSEFFKQRRRWGPSTLANIVDLLGTWKTTVMVNDNISTLYMLYQMFLMISTILGPATVILMMAGSFNVVFKINIFKSYSMAIVPAVFYIIVCLVSSSSTQVMVAATMSAIYAIVMMVVVVGTLMNAFDGSITSPNVFFLIMLGVIFFTAAILHPEEVLCIIPGALYFICIPSGYLLLTIYYLCNLNVVTWGTREMPKKKTRKQKEKERKVQEEKRMEKAKKKGILSWFGIDIIFKEMSEMFRQLKFLTESSSNRVSRTDELLEAVLVEMRRSRNSETEVIKCDSAMTQTHEEFVRTNSTQSSNNINKVDSIGNILSLPDTETMYSDETHYKAKNSLNWLKCKSIGNGPIRKLGEREDTFWKQVLEKYLYPLKEDSQQQERVQSDLKEMRNSTVFAFFMTSTLWIAMSMQLHIMQDELKDKLFFRIPRLDPTSPPLTIEPLGMIFLVFFALIMTFQFFGMIMHRWGTILHVIAITDVSCSRSMSEADEVREIIRRTMEMQRVSNIENEPYSDYPLPDYNVDTDDDEDYDASIDTETSFSSDLCPRAESDFILPGYAPHMEVDRTRSNQSRGKSVFSKSGFTTGHTLRRAFLKRYMQVLLNKDHPYHQGTISNHMSNAASSWGTAVINTPNGEMLY